MRRYTRFNITLTRLVDNARAALYDFGIHDFGFRQRHAKAYEADEYSLSLLYFD